MNNNNWYISRGFSVGDIDTTLKILDVLEYKKHKVLCRINECPPSHIRKSESEHEWFDAYVIGVAYLGNVTDMNQLEKNLRDIFLRKYGENKEDADFINEEPFSIKRLMKKFSDMDKETLDELSHSFSEMTDYYRGSLVNTAVPEDKFHYIDAEDWSFGSYYWNQIMKINHNKCPEIDDELPEFRRTWVEMDINYRGFISALHTEFELIITDDTDNISNFIYYLNVMDYDDWILAVNDNQDRLGELVNTDLLDICSEVNQFTKYTGKPLTSIYDRE